MKSVGGFPSDGAAVGSSKHVWLHSICSFNLFSGQGRDLAAEGQCIANVGFHPAHEQGVAA